jgi:hypothetical protein
MSVYRATGSKFYVYDFRRGGRRFLGPTGKTSEREARRVEDNKIAAAEREVAAASLTAAEFKGDRPLTLDAAAGRWWNERGRYRADADDCFTAIAGLIEHFGKDRRLDRIADADIATLVATVRGRRVRGKAMGGAGRAARLLSPARVNRITVDLLRAIFGRARRSWKIAIATEPDWREHRLAEPEEITRELSDAEQAALTTAAHPDYERVYRFARLSGLRLKACLIRKSDVKWDAGRIEVRSKHGKLNRVPLSESLRALLAECWDDHTTDVFSYRAHRTHKGLVKGKRYPITVSGLKSQWKRDRRGAAEIAPSIVNFRFHDNRHTAATRILRSTGNLKIAQRLLNHARISTTAKYAHVLDEEVSAAMNATADAATPNRDAESRETSRGKRRGAA